MREIYKITNRVNIDPFSEDLREKVLFNYSVQFGNVDQNGRAEWHLRKDGSIKVFANGGINLINNMCHISDYDELKENEGLSDAWDSEIEDILVNVIENRGNEFGRTIEVMHQVF
jgi:hypothetical protein